MSQTEAIVQHHIEAYGKGDLDGVVSDFREDAVILYENRRIAGREAIRAFYADFMKNALPPATPVELKALQVDGDTAYMVWSAETDALSIKLASDTFVMKDGKILKQTLASYVEPRG